MRSRFVSRVTGLLGLRLTRRVRSFVKRLRSLGDNVDGRSREGRWSVVNIGKEVTQRRTMLGTRVCVSGWKLINK